MTTDELDRSLRQLRLGGMADAVSVRSQQARAENLGPLDFISLLVHDELQRRRDRLIARRAKPPAFATKEPSIHLTGNSTRSTERSSSNSPTAASSNSTKTLCCSATPALARATSPRHSAWRHLAGFRVLYREAHVLFEDLLGQRHRRTNRGDRDVQRDSAAHHRRFGNA